MARSSLLLSSLLLCSATSVQGYAAGKPTTRAPFFVTVVEDEVATVALESSPTVALEEPAPRASTKVPARTAPPAAPAKVVKKKKNAEGIFAPVVLTAKDILGDAQLNKLRAKAISLHSQVIGSFVSTSSSEFGEQTLELFFQLADTNSNGTIEKEELAAALHFLGFDFLKEKQISGIMKRSTKNDPAESLTLEEFKAAAPPTLRTNLIKLAKKNGHDLGFLA